MVITRYQALSENSVVGPRASGCSSGKDDEAGDIGCIVDGAGRRPDGQQRLVREQIKQFKKTSRSKPDRFFQRSLG